MCNRVRTARLELLREPMNDSDYLVKRNAGRRAQLAAKIATKVGSIEIATEFLRQNLGPAPEADESERVAAVIADLSQQLARLDRYERRARSRRKFAVRALDRIASLPMLKQFTTYSCKLRFGFWSTFWQNKAISS